jgi:hypothetical protein
MITHKTHDITKAKTTDQNFTKKKKDLKTGAQKEVKNGISHQKKQHI